MRKYFFGYLFVRIAKAVAIFVLVIGVCYALFKVVQGRNAAESVRYQPSVALQQHLDKLTTRLTESRRLVSSSLPEIASDKLPAVPKFPANVSSGSEFEKLTGQLKIIDQQRQTLKEAIIDPFESLVLNIEEKLRAHAAAVAPQSVLPKADSATPKPTSSATVALAEQATLFSAELPASEIAGRMAAIDQGVEGLKVLESTAENDENRKTLSAAVESLGALKRLLPVPRADVVAEPAAASTERAEVVPSTREPVNAEKVASALAEIRAVVRRAVLSSWALDLEYEETMDLASRESNQCRVSNIAEKGVWLTTFGQVASAVVAAAFVAFLVLVMADLMQTLLDTATNTGLLAQKSIRDDATTPPRRP